MVKTIATGQISIIDYTDAPSLSAYISTNSPKTQAYNPNTKEYIPDWGNTTPLLTPSLMVSSMGTADQISSADVKWYDADSPSTEITTGDNYEISNKSLKIKKNLLTGNVYSKTFIAKIVWRNGTTGSNLTVTCDFTFNRVNHGETGSSGEAAIVAVLSNETHAVPTDANGNNAVYGGASTTISVYKGATDDSAAWSYAAKPTNVTGSFSDQDRTYTVTGLLADTGYVDITASRSGYASITKRFTVTKNKQGVQGSTGASATAYWLVSSAAAIGKDSTGKYTPATVTFSAKSQTGTGSPTAYNGRFIITESSDGTNFNVEKYKSTTNESSYTHTPSAGIKAVKVQLYLAGGTTTLLDEEIISVVTDGTQGPAGQDAVFVSAWAPEGNVFKNDAIPSLTAKAEVYKGGAIVTSGVTYQWYKQKTGTADQGAGAGWLKLTTSNAATEGVTGSVTAATLTVTADAVVNTCGFKIVATYNNKSYTDTVVFTDQTDPIMVVVDSSAGNIFKNGNISTRLTCRLYQNGEEVDVAGTSATEGYKYTYTWSKVNADGNQDMSFTKTNGKWIDITDKDVNSKAVFRVEIS